MTRTVLRHWVLPALAATDFLLVNALLAALFTLYGDALRSFVRAWVMPAAAIVVLGLLFWVLFHVARIAFEANEEEANP